MQKVLTRDGSETFINKDFNESYHSFTGAVEEAREKYCIPTKIKERAIKDKHITILDFAFGMGYNSAMAITIAKEANPNCVIKIIGLEKDPKIIQKIQEVNPNISDYQFYKQLTPTNLKIISEDNTVSVKILLGDANQTIKQLVKDSVDVIFYDPFSPKTQPSMWKKELFKEAKRILKPKKGILATYSCARLVRDNMRAAGLTYKDGPKVGRRGPGTIAWE